MSGLAKQLLSEALDLCVRARKLDEAAADITHATIPLWVQDQYERDLADWEKRARAALQCPAAREGE